MKCYVSVQVMYLLDMMFIVARTNFINKAVDLVGSRFIPFAKYKQGRATGKHEDLTEFSPAEWVWSKNRCLPASVLSGSQK